MRFLLFLFIAMPILEMWVLIKVGSSIGALSTIALVLLTAMVGLALIRSQGLSTLTRINQKMAEGQLPATELLEGFFLAIGGALLLTPGFITDAIGFSCLIPLLRVRIIGLFLKRGWLQAQSNFNAQAHYRQQSSSPVGPNNIDGKTTIEGDFKRED